MKKLEDIPKKEIFNVPEGYFEKLPAAIQTRVAERSTTAQASIFVRYRLQYAIPVVLLMAFGIYWLNSPAEATDVNTLLASVNTEQMIAYLNESDISTEDLMEHLGTDELLPESDAEEDTGDYLDPDTVELDHVFDDIDFENI